jgi:hypothetical protein
VTYPFVPDEKPAGGQAMTTATQTAPITPSALLPCVPRPSAGPGEGTLARAVVAAAAYALVLVVTVRAVGEPLFDPDVWWHLRVGQWIAQNGAVTGNDPFSLPGQYKSWVAYSWLYELALYGLVKAFGLAGIIVYRAAASLLVVAAVHSLIRRLEPRRLVADGLTTLAALCLAPLMSERQWLLTILFAALTLRVVVELRDARRPAWWVCLLPLVYVIWANVHVQFVYGLFILALALAAPLIDSALGRVPASDSAATAFSRGWQRLLVLSALCAAATLVNPYGVRLYFVVLEYATQPGPFRYVNELKAMEFREPTDWLILGLSGAACFALGRRKVNAFEALVLLGAAYFAFRARRDVWFLALADLYVLATTGPANGRDDKPSPLPWRAKAAIVAGLAALALLLGWARDLSPAGLERRVASVFPVEAAKVVRERGDAGPLYNDFNWGGYLIWALPDHPVAIDGRTNLHGDERIERFGRTWCALPGWREDEDLSAANVVIAAVDSALAEQLRSDERFGRPVHEDRVAVVFVRRKE